MNELCDQFENCTQKTSTQPVFGATKGSEFTLNNQGGSHSFRINLVSFRTFRDPQIPRNYLEKRVFLL